MGKIAQVLENEPLRTRMGGGIRLGEPARPHRTQPSDVASEPATTLVALDALAAVFLAGAFADLLVVFVVLAMGKGDGGLGGGSDGVHTRRIRGRCQ